MRRALWSFGLLGGLILVSSAQNGGWTPLGAWELVERLDDVQVVRVLRAGDLLSVPFPPKPTWMPDFGASDFEPASDVQLYRRFATQGQYYAYESDYIMLDDVVIRRQLDPSEQGRFRVSRVEIAVYFPFPGFYQIQGHWSNAEGNDPPNPSSVPPNTFLRGNQGPHTLFVPQAGVWRLATNADPLNEVFTIQCSELSDVFDSQRRFLGYVGLLLEPPAAWVCGPLPGTDLNLDYFVQFENGEYEAYQLQNQVPATFALILIGAAAPVTQLQGTITIDGYVGSYAGKQATIRIKQGTSISTYTVTLTADGSYSLRPNETGNAEVWVKLAPGLARKVNLSLSGTVNQNFQLISGDLNNDNLINDADLLQVLFGFGTNDANADANGDGVVNDADLLMVLFNFGQSGDSL